jgi:hypothetical protein
MYLFLALMILSPLAFAQRPPKGPLPVENEAQVVGSEVKVLPDKQPGAPEEASSVAPAPIFSEPPPSQEAPLTTPAAVEGEAQPTPLAPELNQGNGTVLGLETTSAAPVEDPFAGPLAASAANATDIQSSLPPLPPPADGAEAPNPDAQQQNGGVLSVEELANPNKTSDELLTTLTPPASAGFDFESNITLTEEQQNITLPLSEEGTNQNLTNPEAPLPASPEAPLDPLNPSNETQIDLLGKNETEPIQEILQHNETSDAANQTLDGNVLDTEKFLLPSKIAPLRVTVIGFTGKAVHTFNLSADQILYQMKAFWNEPESWQDIGYQPSDRVFELFCWLNTNGGFGRDLFRGNLSASLIAHSQWYAFPEAEDNSTTNITANCGIRPFNGAGKSGDWTFSDPAPIKEAPVFLRGFENVNVRGWSKEEVVRLIKNQKRLDSPQTLTAQKAAQAKQKSKSRRV